MSIVVEESDESQLWMEVIEDSGIDNSPELKRLRQESLEITKVCSKASNSASG